MLSFIVLPKLSVHLKHCWTLHALVLDLFMNQFVAKKMTTLVKLLSTVTTLIGSLSVVDFHVNI